MARAVEQAGQRIAARQLAQRLPCLGQLLLLKLQLFGSLADHGLQSRLACHQSALSPADGRKREQQQSRCQADLKRKAIPPRRPHHKRENHKRRTDVAFGIFCVDLKAKFAVGKRGIAQIVASGRVPVLFQAHQTVAIHGGGLVFQAAKIRLEPATVPWSRAVKASCPAGWGYCPALRWSQSPAEAAADRSPRMEQMRKPVGSANPDRTVIVFQE